MLLNQFVLFQCYEHQSLFWPIGDNEASDCQLSPYCYPNDTKSVVAVGSKRKKEHFAHELLNASSCLQVFRLFSDIFIFQQNQCPIFALY